MVGNMQSSSFGQGAPVRGRADIVICLDVTGSMQGCIDRLKGHIGSFVEELERARDFGGAQVSVTDWRIRVLAFRDLFAPRSLPVMVDDFPFVTTAAEVRAQLQDPRLRAEGGGGNGSESSLDAVYIAAQRSRWRKAVLRVVIVFTDDYTLEQLHDSTVGQGSPKDVDVVAQALKEHSVGVVVFGPDDKVMRRLAGLRPKVGRASRFFESVEAADAFFGGTSMEFEELLRSLAATVSVASFGVY